MSSNQRFKADVYLSFGQFRSLSKHIYFGFNFLSHDCVALNNGVLCFPLVHVLDKKIRENVNLNNELHLEGG